MYIIFALVMVGFILIYLIRCLIRFGQNLDNGVIFETQYKQLLDPRNHKNEN